MKKIRRFTLTDGQYLLLLDIIRNNLEDRIEDDDSLFCSNAELKELHKNISKRHNKELGGGF